MSGVFVSCTLPHSIVVLCFINTYIDIMSKEKASEHKHLTHAIITFSFP